MRSEDPVWVAAPATEAEGRLAEGGVPNALAPLLARRGVTSVDEAEAFLHPSAEQLHDPFLLGGMEEAVARLDKARGDGERIALVGDYDVDGISATALGTAVLGAWGMDVTPILPDRLREGYGFQPVHVEKASEVGAKLILTADCGTTSGPAIQAAQERGIEVLVTDHHLPGRLPKGVLQINPKQEDCEYPFPDLCGAGLVFKLLQALAMRWERPFPLESLLRITCLATIADLVPLLGENRVIARLGLEALGQSRSEGLRALIRESGVHPPLRAEDVGFRLGPRLNAAGRLHDPHMALRLLLTRDASEAREIATLLGRWNRERQDEEARVVQEARELFASRDPLPSILVGWSESWHRGVVGIAAGRMARELHRPTLLLSVADGVAVGSGRSVAEVHLHDFFGGWSEELERFGGHAQAIGMTVAVERLATLREEWEEAAGRWPEEWLRRRYRYELEIPAESVDRSLLQRLEALEPHGQGNPRPLLRVGPLRWERPPRRFGKGHVKGWTQGGEGGRVALLGWRWADRIGDEEGAFEILGYLEEDRYLGEPILRIEDLRRWSPSEGAERRMATSDPGLRSPGEVRE